ncbi:MAG: DnaJ C-terminal domain-containing protein [Patescibacteria group bacterium]
MAENKDYYEILGVTKTSSHDEIKKAYRKLALKYHPDHNKTKEGEAQFKEVTKAYEVLSNEEKRKSYDQFGHAAFEQGGAGGAGGPFGGFGGQQGGQYGPFTYTYSGNGGAGDFGGFSDPFDIFEQFFGGGGSPFGSRQRRPAYRITISFDEAVHGTEKQVTIDNKTQKIKIPAGVDSGSRIRFDAYDVVVEVAQDTRFQRQGYDIVSEKEVSYAQAALGEEINVETIDGSVKIRIPAGTQPGTLIRLSGRGVKHVQGSGKGDHYVKIVIQVPRKLSKRQKELFEALRREE